MIPLLYAFGRVFIPKGYPSLKGAVESMYREDLIWVAKAVVGAGAVVGLVGLVELWFVPTSAWVEMGARLFSSWLGFEYRGPGGLPENFVHSTSIDLALRRMVSTYISPLGIAYTGILVFPLAMGLIAARRRVDLRPALVWWGLALLTLGILFSVTRGALLGIAGASLLLVLMLRRREVVIPGALTIIGVALVLYEYVNVGPLITADLKDVRLPAGYALIQDAWTGLTGYPPAIVPITTTGGMTIGGELPSRPRIPQPEGT
jgi:hypothetical protein